MNGYGERLALALRNKGMKQIELAEKLHIKQSAVSKILNGAQYLSFDLAVRACEALNISLDSLAYGRETEKQPQYFLNPERQRIEYLLSILQEAEYPLVIVAMEEIVEIRLKK
jgi:transcriptional regulator with XRE-family HTH domain